MRTIGTDVSLDVCKAEGYLIARFDARKKFTPQMDVYFTRYWPDYNPLAGETLVATYRNLEDIYEAYQMDKAGIDSFADINYLSMDEITNVYELLNLADSVDSYNGCLNW